MTLRVATYAPTRPIEYLLEGAAGQTIQCPIQYGTDGIVAPDSGVITITKPDGTAFVSGAEVVVSSSIASYTLTPAASETLGDGWTVDWTLTFAGVAYPTYRYKAILCEYVPHCPIALGDLYTYEPELRHRIPQSQGDRGDNTGWQPQIDSGYYSLIEYLISNGRHVWEIRGMTGTREWLRTKILMLCCRALATSDNSVWARKATDYRYEHRLAVANLKIQYTSDPASIRRGGSPVIRLAPVGRPVF